MLHSLSSNPHHVSNHYASLLNCLLDSVLTCPKSVLHAFICEVVPKELILFHISFSPGLNPQLCSPVTEFIFKADKVTSLTVHSILLFTSVSWTTGHFAQVHAVLGLVDFYSSFQTQIKRCHEDFLILGKSCLIFAIRVLLQHSFRHFKYLSAYFVQDKRIQSGRVKDGRF